MSRLGSWGRKLWEDFYSVFSPTRKAIRVIHDVESPFGEFLVADRTPIIELNSTYGFSNLRDLKEELNGGAVTRNGAEFQLSTGTDPDGYVRLESAEIGRYIPGYGAEVGIGIRTPTLDNPVGNQVIRWGGYGENENNGLYFGKDATGTFVALLRDGVENKVYQSDWNVDPLDGSGPSTYNIDTDDGHIYQIVFTWYGYGQIDFGVLASVNNTQRFIVCHSYSAFAQTSIESPNLKVFAEVDNNGTADDITIYVGGRQYSIIGKYIPKYRFTGEFRGSVSTTTTVVPLITFRRKNAFGDRSVKLQGFDVISSTQPHIIEIRVNGSLTGASFGTPTNYSASETALEVDKSATAITGGDVIWTQLVPSGGGTNAQLGNQEVDFDIPNGENVTICVRTLTGNGSVTSCLRMREEW